MEGVISMTSSNDVKSIRKRSIENLLAKGTALTNRIWSHNLHPSWHT